MSIVAEALKEVVFHLLKSKGILSGSVHGDQLQDLRLQPLKADGSTRKFFRVYKLDKPLCVAVLPAGKEKRDLAEFRAAMHIGTHLGNMAIPVPEIIGTSEHLGLLLFEDLGDVRLHGLLGTDRSTAMQFYRETVTLLARMQVDGAKGFDYQWCFDSPSYDKALMLERESGYFARAFLEDMISSEKDDGLVVEFAELAEKTDTFYQPYFLHRDFQSRNIMITDGQVRFIDFQAGRIGPPGYDIASLLIDPYAGLSDSIQNELFERYLNEIEKYPETDGAMIKTSFPYLAIQRNLQIIGAFAFLSVRKKKPFFKQYIMPSLIMLQNRLTEKEFECFPVLRKTVSSAIQQLRKHLSG